MECLCRYSVVALFYLFILWSVPKGTTGSCPQLVATITTGGDTLLGNTTARDLGTYVGLACHPGYKLEGGSVSKCVASSGLHTWVPGKPKCTLKQTCPNTIAGVSLPATDRVIGQHVTVTCADGFQASPVATITCLSSGQWSSEISCVSEATERRQDNLVIIIASVTCGVVLLVVILMACCCQRWKEQDKTVSLAGSHISKKDRNRNQKDKIGTVAYVNENLQLNDLKSDSAETGGFNRHALRHNTALVTRRARDDIDLEDALNVLKNKGFFLTRLGSVPSRSTRKRRRNHRAEVPHQLHPTRGPPSSDSYSPEIWSDPEDCQPRKRPIRPLRIPRPNYSHEPLYLKSGVSVWDPPSVYRVDEHPYYNTSFPDRLFQKEHRSENEELRATMIY